MEGGTQAEMIVLVIVGIGSVISMHAWTTLTSQETHEAFQQSPAPCSPELAIWLDRTSPFVLRFRMLLGKKRNSDSRPKCARHRKPDPLLPEPGIGFGV